MPQAILRLAVGPWCLGAWSFTGHSSLVIGHSLAIAPSSRRSLIPPSTIHRGERKLWRMALTYSKMLELGTAAPAFSLPDTTGKKVSLSDFKQSPALLVMFICNHCPYVRHVAGAIAQLAREYQAKGVAVVAINSNDANSYPADSPAMMKEEVKRMGYTFPYLYDDTQAVAKAYRAACTPEFYLFDRQQNLAYRGRLDGSTPGNNIPPTGEDLRAALEAVLAGRPAQAEQKPSMGCNIKWK